MKAHKCAFMRRSMERCCRTKSNAAACGQAMAMSRSPALYVGGARRVAAAQCSGRLDVTAVAFELDFGDAVERHAHLGEPRCDGVLAGGFHDADRFAFSQVGEAPIAFDVGILLGRLGKLADLVRRELARRNGVSAHEFCHNNFLSICVVWSDWLS